MKEQKTNVTYEFVTGDEHIDVPLVPEVAAYIADCDRRERNYANRTIARRWHYSLDQGDNIEVRATLKALAPAEILETDLSATHRLQDRRAEKVQAALATLTAKQSARIHQRFFDQLTMCEIARREGVDESTVRKCINTSLVKLAALLADELSSSHSAKGGC